jgi:hypothetical protein
MTLCPAQTVATLDNLHATRSDSGSRNLALSTAPTDFFGRMRQIFDDSIRK